MRDDMAVLVVVPMTRLGRSVLSRSVVYTASTCHQTTAQHPRNAVSAATEHVTVRVLCAARSVDNACSPTATQVMRDGMPCD